MVHCQTVKEVLARMNHKRKKIVRSEFLLAMSIYEYSFGEEGTDCWTCCKRRGVLHDKVSWMIVVIESSLEWQLGAGR